ncbi:MAG: hypothetical protein QXW70_01015 [Candidatus Anstonellales archaeon]
MDELTFLDLAVLRRIDDDTVVERFGSKINTSFFESANLLGSMKVKGYIDFETVLGGMSKVSLTESGRHLLKRATEKAQEDLDSLDDTILAAIGRGTTDPDKISVEISVKPSDVAFRLDKLVYNNYIDYTIRNAKITLALTEAGFNRIGTVKGEVKKEKDSYPQTHTYQASKTTSDDGSSDDAKELISAQIKDDTNKDKTIDQHLTRLMTKTKYYLEKYLLYFIILIVIIVAITYLLLNMGA